MSIFKNLFHKNKNAEEWVDDNKNDYDDDDDYDINDVPEGCRACGGDYPNCTTSCPLFDD